MLSVCTIIKPPDLFGGFIVSVSPPQAGHRIPDAFPYPPDVQYNLMEALARKCAMFLSKTLRRYLALNRSIWEVNYKFKRKFNICRYKFIGLFGELTKFLLTGI